MLHHEEWHAIRMEREAEVREIMRYNEVRACLKARNQGGHAVRTMWKRVMAAFASERVHVMYEERV